MFSRSQGAKREKLERHQKSLTNPRIQKLLEKKLFIFLSLPLLQGTTIGEAYNFGAMQKGSFFPPPLIFVGCP